MGTPRGKIAPAAGLTRPAPRAAVPILYGHRTQYQAFVLPFLVLAAVTGYSRLAARRDGRWPVAILVVAFAVSLVLASSLVNELAVARW